MKSPVLAMLMAHCLAFSEIMPAVAVVPANAGAPPFREADWNFTIPIARADSAVCSGTVIGPRTVITAASCTISNRTGLHAPVKIGGTLYYMSCERHPGFVSNELVDIALCQTGTDLPVPAATLTTSPVAPGNSLTMVGYGCLQGDILRTTQGSLAAGAATVTNAPVANGDRPYAIVKGDNPCPGDNGGGAYNTTAGAKVLAGIITRSISSDSAVIPLVSDAAFVTWAQKWSAKNNAKICGLKGDMSGCAVPLNIVSVALLSPVVAVVAAPPVPSPIGVSQLSSLSSDDQAAINSAIATFAKAGSPVLPPQTILAAPKSMTIEKLVEDTCPGVSKDFFTLLDRSLAAQNATYNSQTVLAANQQVALPVCPLVQPVPVWQTVPAGNGDLEQNFVRQLNLPGNKWLGLKNNGPETDRMRSHYYASVFLALNPQLQAAEIPNTGEVNLPEFPAPAIEEAIPAEGGDGSVRALLAFQASNQQCDNPDNIVRDPIGMDLVLEALELNKTGRRTDHRTFSTVLVADSGLYGAGTGPFSKQVIVTGQASSFEDFVQRTLPYGADDALGHGTAVADLALGGSSFARLNALSPTPWVMIAVNRIYRKYVQNGTSPWYGPEDAWFSQVKKAAIAESANIVNLSLETHTEIAGMASELDSSSNLLFVVAAGNDPKPLGGDSVPDYPQMEVHSGSVNFLSVAATDQDHLAKLSNWGPGYIEIGAPGCSIEVPKFNSNDQTWTTQALSGTSLSAPIVSFAAALARAEMEGAQPADVKRRLLISADLESAMSDKIEDGRVLDIPKAVAVYEDVVELPSAAGATVSAPNHNLQFGDVWLLENNQIHNPSDQISLSCTDIPDDAGVQHSEVFTISDILKITPGFINRAGTRVLKIYSMPKVVSGTLFENSQCTMPDNMAIELRDAESRRLSAYKLADVKDVVFHTKNTDSK